MVSFSAAEIGVIHNMLALMEHSGVSPAQMQCVLTGDEGMYSLQFLDEDMADAPDAVQEMLKHIHRIIGDDLYTESKPDGSPELTAISGSLDALYKAIKQALDAKMQEKEKSFTNRIASCPN